MAETRSTSKVEFYDPEGSDITGVPTTIKALKDLRVEYVKFMDIKTGFNVNEIKTIDALVTLLERVIRHDGDPTKCGWDLIGQIIDTFRADTMCEQDIVGIMFNNRYVMKNAFKEEIKIEFKYVLKSTRTVRPFTEGNTKWSLGNGETLEIPELYTSDYDDSFTVSHLERYQ